MNDLRRLIHEIHRRSLWQVLGIYLLGSWIALQVVDVLANNFGLPDWFPAFALALLVIGLPIVLATAFVQEGMSPRKRKTRAAGRRTERHAPARDAFHQNLFSWRNAILGGVCAFALWGVVAAGWLLLGPGLGAGMSSGSEARSIAVLPFANRSAAEEDQFFVDGIHDDLLTQLAKIDGLTVISRTSVMRYRDGGKSIPEIARELGVATVLEGGVQRAGDRVRVTVQLIEARRDKHLWAETYDEQLLAANIFAIQTDLAKKIASALRTTLAAEVEQRLAEAPTQSLEAYDLYTRGRYLYYSFETDVKASLETVADLYRRAIAADSNYAPAYAGLADVYAYGISEGVFRSAEVRPQAWALLEKALDLDDNLAEAHSRRGLMLMDELRYPEAERAFARALDLGPGSAVVHRRYAGLLGRLGRNAESIQASRRAVELDPLSPLNRTALADRLISTGDYDGAIAEIRKVLEMSSGSAYAHYSLGIALALKGEHSQALATLARAVELGPDDPSSRAVLAWAHARAGQREEALAALKLVPEEGAMLQQIAIVYGELGELDRAFEYLERAYKEEPLLLPGLKLDRTASALRADPRYAQLMKRLGAE